MVKYRQNTSPSPSGQFDSVKNHKQIVSQLILDSAQFMKNNEKVCDLE